MATTAAADNARAPKTNMNVRSRVRTPDHTRVLVCAREYALPIVCFVVLALCSHALFLSQFFGTTFASFSYAAGDATSQLIPAISLLENALLSGDMFWSFSYGLGGDVYSEFSYYYSTSPFFYLMFLVKCVFGAAGADFATTQAWRLIASIIKQVLCMTFMYSLCRQEKRTKVFSCLGAIMYGCSFWFIDNSFAFDFMTDAMLWPPLIVMAYNRFRRTNKPLALIVCAALALANNFYFAYMLVLFLIIFALVFSLPLGEVLNEAKEKCHLFFVRLYARRVGVLALIMVASFALAAIAFLPSVQALLQADRVATSASSSILPAHETRALLPEIFFLGYTPASVMDLQTYAFPLALLLVLFIRWKSASADVIKKTLLAAVMLALSISPAASSLFSGMSYPSNRWCYLVVFAVAYAFPAWMETLVEQKRIKAVALGFVVLVVGVCFATLNERWLFANEVSGYEFPAIEGTVAAHLVLGGAFIVALAALQIERIPAFGKTALLYAAGMIFVASYVVIMPFGPLCVATNTCTHAGVEYYESYEQLNESFEGSASTQAAYQALQGVQHGQHAADEQDASATQDTATTQDATTIQPYTQANFARVIDVETTTEHTFNDNEARVENRSWINGAQGTSAYNSMLPRSLNSALKKSYAVTSTTISASQYRGLGNRLFLENAWGVSYKFNVEHDTNTPLAGYSPTWMCDETTIWENENACGIDLWYTSVLSLEQAQSLSYGQRDALLLQTAVVPNAQDYDLPLYQGESASRDNATFIDVSTLPLTCEGCTIEAITEEATAEEAPAEEGTAQASTAQNFIVNAGSDSVVRLELPEIDGAYLLSFNTENPNLWGCSFFVNGTEYYLSAADGRWEYDQTTLCVSVPGNAQTLEIQLPWGYFQVKNCTLEAVSYNSLSAWTENVNRVNLEDVHISGSNVSGEISAPEAGILALNIPYNSGWHCIIDGQETPVFCVSEMFCGVAVQPGNHHVQFYYQNNAFVVGAVVSVLSLAVLVIATFAVRVARKTSTRKTAMQKTAAKTCRA